MKKKKKDCCLDTFKIAKLMLERNLTIQDIATQTGISITLAWRLSRDFENINPSFCTIIKLAKALDVNVNDLVIDRFKSS